MLCILVRILWGSRWRGTRSWRTPCNGFSNSYARTAQGLSLRASHGSRTMAGPRRRASAKDKDSKPQITALDGIDLDCCARANLRPARTQRRGKIHHRRDFDHAGSPHRAARPGLANTMLARPDRGQAPDRSRGTTPESRFLAHGAGDSAFPWRVFRTQFARAYERATHCLTASNSQTARTSLFGVFRRHDAAHVDCARYDA